MSVVTSARGWPVRRGDRLRVTSLYSDTGPQRTVMGIMHLYIAPGRGRTTRCPANPGDVKEHRLASRPVAAPSRYLCDLQSATMATATRGRAPD